jgi:hypothetical protein
MTLFSYDFVQKVLHAISFLEKDKLDRKGGLSEYEKTK